MEGAYFNDIWCLNTEKYNRFTLANRRKFETRRDTVRQKARKPRFTVVKLVVRIIQVAFSRPDVN